MTPVKRPLRGYPLHAMLLVAAGLFAGTTILPWAAPGTTPDSLRYLEAAAQLAGSGEFGSDYLLWPPLYPTVLAGFAALHLQNELGYLNYALLAASLYLTMLLVRELGAGVALMILAGLAVACSSPYELIFRTVWSEVLELPLMLGCLVFWSRYLQSRSPASLAAACLLAGLCLLTRHAAIPLTATMNATLFLCRDKGGKLGLARPLVAIVLASLPYAAWLLRTYLLSGTWTGQRSAQSRTLHTLALGPPATLSHWLLPGIYLHHGDPMSFAASALLLLVPAILALRVLGKRGAAPPPNTPENTTGQGHELALTALVFVISYLGFLAWSVMRSHLEIPGERYLAPIFVPLLLLILYCARHAPGWAGYHRERLRGLLTGAGLLWLAAEVLLP